MSFLEQPNKIPDTEEDGLKAELEAIRAKARDYLNLPREKFYIEEYRKIQAEEEAMLRLIRDHNKLLGDAKFESEGRKVIQSNEEIVDKIIGDTTND